MMMVYNMGISFPVMLICPKFVPATLPDQTIDRILLIEFTHDGL
jgi:hypothetical protein